MDHWSNIDSGLDALLSCTNARLKGPRLQEVCTAMQQRIDSEDADNNSVRSRVQCFIKTMELLAKLLSARKRARDWKQQEYSCRVGIVLAAATAVLEQPSLLANPVVAGNLGKKLLADTQLLALVAAAQQEVAQLLTAQVQQQQQPGNQQQQQQQGQGLLLHVGQELLLWWLGAYPLWGMSSHRQSLAKGKSAAAAQWYFVYHMPAVELAAAVVQAAGPNCTFEHFRTVAHVVTIVAAFHKVPDQSSVVQEAAVARYTSAAYLRLVLLLLLTHSYCCSTLQLPLLGQDLSSTNSTSATASSSSSSSTAPAAGPGVAGASLQQQQQQQQLADSLTNMWQQLGMKAASLAVFADAMQADGELQVAVLASVDSYSGSGAPILLLPEDRPLLLRALCHMMHELHEMLLSMLDCPEWDVPAVLGDDGDSVSQRGQQQQQRALTRQQQRLLQAVGLQLPQVLLRTALLCGAGEPMLVASAAAASTRALLCWRNACQAEAAATNCERQREQVLPGAFDCWLQLLQQQLLLQPPLDGSCSQPTSPAALFAVAVAYSANGRTAAQQHSSGAPQQQQQQQQQPSGLLLQVAATARVVQGSSAEGQQILDAAQCSCVHLNDLSGDRSLSRKISCVRLDYGSLHAVERLLQCLAVMKAGVSGVFGSAGGVLLLLEVLARRVLPHHITCSKSSASNERSSAAMRVSVALCNTLMDESASLHSLWLVFIRAALSHPQQLQPRVVALVASLHKLSNRLHMARNPQRWFYTRMLTGIADAARITVGALHVGGVADAIGYDLRTWRHILAPWVVLLGRCCWVVGHWLQLLHCEDWEQLGSSSSSAGFIQTAARNEARAALPVLKEVLGFLQHKRLHEVQSLWETCSIIPSNDDNSSVSSSSTEDCDSGTGPAYAKAWEQWQCAAGQQRVPAYGSLAADFARLLQGQTAELLRLCWSLMQKAYKRIDALEAASTTGRPSSSSSSSSHSSSDDSLGGVDGGTEISDAALGFLQDQWDAAVAAIHEAGSAPSVMQACMGFTGFAALGAELQAVGGGMCAKLPLPWLCNNPLCSSMGGASELQLVGGSSCVCGGCRVARYCGVACQAAHWGQHKPVCRELAAAAAAQAAQASAAKAAQAAAAGS